MSFRRKPRIDPYKMPKHLDKGGLRIYHPTVRGAVLLIPVPKKRPEGSDKDVQIVVDADGYALVSEGVWNSLIRARTFGALHDFIVVGVVDDPPGLRLGDGVESHRRTYRQEQAALREIAPAGVATRVVSTPIRFRSN